MCRPHCSQEAICQGNFLCYALLRIVKLDRIFLTWPHTFKCSFLCHNMGIHSSERLLSLSIRLCKKSSFDTFWKSWKSWPSLIKRVKTGYSLPEMVNTLPFFQLLNILVNKINMPSILSIADIQLKLQFFLPVLQLPSHCLLFPSSEDSDILLLSKECSEEGGETANMWLISYKDIKMPGSTDFQWSGLSRAKAFLTKFQLCFCFFPFFVSQYCYHSLVRSILRGCFWIFSEVLHKVADAIPLLQNSHHRMTHKKPSHLCMLYGVVHLQTHCSL